MARAGGQAPAGSQRAPGASVEQETARTRATDGYRAFLAVPGAPRLLISSIVARLPLGMAGLSILLLVHQEKHSFTPAGLVVGALTLASAASAPVQGALVDRYGGRRILPPFAASQAAALVALAVLARAGAPTAALLAIGAIAGALVPPVSGSVRVLWRDVAPSPRVMEAAYQLDATSQEVIWTSGPLLVALISAWSPEAAVLATAVIVLGGTLTFVSAPLAARSSGSGRTRRPGAALTSPVLRLQVMITVLLGVGIGVVEVGLPALALRAGARGATGILLTAWSIGSMAGGFLYGLRSWRPPIETRLPILIALIAVGAAPLIAARSLAAAIPLSLVAGLGFAPVVGCQYLLIAKLTPPDLAGEAFMWWTASLVTGIAAGTALGGPLAQEVGVSSAFVVSVAANALAAVVALAGRGRVHAGTASSEAPAPRL